MRDAEKAHEMGFVTSTDERRRDGRTPSDTTRGGRHRTGDRCVCRRADPHRCNVAVRAASSGRSRAEHLRATAEPDRRAKGHPQRRRSADAGSEMRLGGPRPLRHNLDSTPAPKGVRIRSAVPGLGILSSYRADWLPRDVVAGIEPTSTSSDGSRASPATTTCTATRPEPCRSGRATRNVFRDTGRMRDSVAWRGRSGSSPRGHDWGRGRSRL
jgi:hypothetical protein